MFLRKNLAILTRSFVETFLLVQLLKAFSRALSPASCGILGYDPTTSAVIKMESLGIVPIFLIFLLKSPESFIYDRLLCFIGFGWLSKSPESYIYIYIYIYIYLILSCKVAVWRFNWNGKKIKVCVLSHTHTYIYIYIYIYIYSRLTHAF